jgi:diaminohydroxyphosphoribosylaminopyrimidine deaminase/5-amino-6-(5-phosphoribosylamino)uracil reductase
LYDNPRLSARNREKGFQPKPYILDMVGEIDNLDYNVFNRKAVLITPSDIYDERGMVKIYRFDKKKDDLKDFILEVFEKGKLHSLMIEGGAKTLSFFMENGLFDEVNVFISPKFIGEGVNPLKFNGIYKIKDAIEMKNIEHKSVGEDFMLKGFRENVYWID